MSARSVALFFHLLGALAFFSGMAVAGSVQAAALRRSRPGEIALLLGVARVGVALVGVGSLLLAGFGLWLVELDGYSLSTGWVAAALALFALAVVLGAAGGERPRQARLLAEELARERDQPSEELRRLLADRRALALNGSALVASLAVLVLMVFRPGG